MVGEVCRIFESEKSEEVLKKNSLFSKLGPREKPIFGQTFPFLSDNRGLLGLGGHFRQLAEVDTGPKAGEILGNGPEWGKALKDCR